MSDERRPILRVVVEAISPIVPLFVMIQLFVLGVGPALWQMSHHPRRIISASCWRDSMVRAAQPSLMAMADKVFSNEKRKLIHAAKGRVLEVGAGTGETLKYYDMGKVDIIYGVEPDLGALTKLNAQVEKHGLFGVYKVLDFGIDEETRMEEAGIVAGSLDTVVCVLADFKRIC